MKKFDLKSVSDENLEAEIERRKAANSCPQQLTNPDIDSLKKVLYNGVQSVIDNEGYSGKDFEHYVFEAAMEAFYGHDIWKWWNKNANY